MINTLIPHSTAERSLHLRAHLRTQLLSIPHIAQQILHRTSFHVAHHHRQNPNLTVLRHLHQNVPNIQILWAEVTVQTVKQLGEKRVVQGCSQLPDDLSGGLLLDLSQEMESLVLLQALPCIGELDTCLGNGVLDHWLVGSGRLQRGRDGFHHICLVLQSIIVGHIEGQWW